MPGRAHLPVLLRKTAGARRATRGMAIFHLQCSHGSRQGGQSALAKVQYVLRQGQYARGRDDLEESDWGHLPEWCAGDPVRLFAAADLHERANGRLYVELEGALPVELDLEHCIALTRAMADVVAATGLPFAWGIHAGRPTEPGKPRNCHFHFVFLERINDGIPRTPEGWFRRANTQDPAAGGAAKDRLLKGHQWLRNVRRRYEQLVNAALERAGRPERVTAASHRDRIARAVAAGDHETADYLRRHPPGQHVGPTACAIERGRPGRPGRPTERGDLARARDAEAARLRAESEGVDHELQELVRAAVAAARDAGVDEESVAAAQSSDPDTVIALDDATESRRRDIRDFVAAVGFDDDMIDDVRGMAAPDNPELGWADVVEWTEAHVAAQVNRARRLGLPVDAIFADARRRGAKPVPHLVRVTQIWAEARRAGFDNGSLGIIYNGAEQRQAGTGWSAIEDVTADIVKEKAEAEAEARAVGLDVEAFYRAAGTRIHPVHALQRATLAKQERIVAAARAALLDADAIERIRVEAESEEHGSGWAALATATEERTKRKVEAEARARGGLPIRLMYEDAALHGTDPVEHLERVSGIWDQALGAGLDPFELIELHHRAEERQDGTGWTAIEDATLAEEERIVAAARAVWLDDDAMERIRREAESKTRGSGWAAVSKATRSRVRRKEAAEVAARDSLVDVDAVYRGARAGNEDELDALKRETAEAKPIVAAARAAGLDDETRSGAARGERAANEDEPSSRSPARDGGEAAVSKATRSRVRRKEAAEVAARDSLVDVDAVYRGARAGNEDELDALKRETAEAKPIVAAARAAGLDDEAIGRTRGEAESQKPGSGWAAVSKATRSRVRRKEAAEVAARDSLVDVDAVYRGARAGNEDELDALKRETAEAKPIVAAARAAGLDDEAIGRTRGEAESQKPGSGWAAVSKATRSRVRRKEAAEVAARDSLVDVDAVCRGARAGNEDELDALKRETAEAKPIVAAARAAGLDDEAIGRIRGEAESQKPGSGWAAVSEATQELTEEQRKFAAAESAMKELAPQSIGGQRPPRDGPEPELTEEERREIDRRAVEMGLVLPPPEPAEEQRPEPEPTEEQRELAAAERAVEELAPQPIEGQRPPRDGPEPELTEEERREIDRRAVEMGLVLPPPEPAEEQRPEPEPTEEQRELAAAERAVEELAPQPIEGQRPPRDGPEPELTEEERREIDRRAVEMGLVSPPPEPAEEQRPEPEPTEEQPELAAAELEPGIDVAAAYAEAREPNQDEVDSLEQGTTEHRKREEEQQRQRRELADLTADVRATTSGAERLDKMRRARLDATKRSLTLDEEMFVVKEVKLQIEADLARRVAAVEASPRGGELLRRVERRRGGPPQSLGEREETIEAVELRVQAADAAVAWLTALAPDPERPDRRVPPVPDAVLDAVPAGGDHPFLGDVVWLVQARFAQAEQKGVDAGGYDAEEREKSARRHFGSALATAFEWCVLTVRALIWAACHKILGGRGDTGARVQASLEAADVERQSYQRTAYEAARTVAIDLNASSEEARADGRDEVAAIAEETARRRQVFSVAVANDITVRTVFDAHEAQAAGSGIPAIEAAIQRRQEAVAAARRLGVDVDAVCTAARSKCEDPVEALQEETARRTKVLLFSDFIGLSDDEFEDIFRAAEEQRRDSGYTAIRNECIRRQAHELVRKELPFGHSRPAQQGTWALAVSAEPRRDLLRGVQDAFVHSTLTDVLAASPGSAEERQGAEYCYHRPEIELELQKLEAQRGWLSSKPTEEDALQAVLAQFIPELADRVRAACDGGGDLDRLVARVVEDDWVRRVVEALPPALPREWPDPGVGSWSTAASDERLTHVAATTDDHRLKKVIVAYQARHDYNPGDRQRAEDVLLERRRREEEESGKTRRQAEAAASRAHDAELLRILQELCRQVQSRDFAEICRERARMRKPSPVHPAIAHNHREQARNRPDHSQGWSR